VRYIISLFICLSIGSLFAKDQVLDSKPEPVYEYERLIREIDWSQCEESFWGFDGWAVCTVYLETESLGLNLNQIYKKPIEHTFADGSKVSLEFETYTSPNSPIGSYRLNFYPKSLSVKKLTWYNVAPFWKNFSQLHKPFSTTIWTHRPEAVNPNIRDIKKSSVYWHSVQGILGPEILEECGKNYKYLGGNHSICFASIIPNVFTRPIRAYQFPNGERLTVSLNARDLKYSLSLSFYGDNGDFSWASAKTHIKKYLNKKQPYKTEFYAATDSLPSHMRKVKPSKQVNGFERLVIPSIHSLPLCRQTYDAIYSSCDVYLTLPFQEKIFIDTNYIGFRRTSSSAFDQVIRYGSSVYGQNIGLNLSSYTIYFHSGHDQPWSSKHDNSFAEMTKSSTVIKSAHWSRGEDF
jgi:hypothetical protein